MNIIMMEKILSVKIVFILVKHVKVKQYALPVKMILIEILNIHVIVYKDTMKLVKYVFNVLILVKFVIILEYAHNAMKILIDYKKHLIVNVKVIILIIKQLVKFVVINV